MGKDKKQYTEADLYGPNGRPHASDIDQDKLFDCYLLAPMGAIAEKQPERINDAIRYNPDTQDFTVTLYRPPNAAERAQGQTDPIRESIVVSQEDIQKNIKKDGGGTVDNNGDRSGPLWPTLIEAGFAEMYGRDSKGKIDLDKGYRMLGDHTLGGALSDGTYALTGESGRNIQIKDPGAPKLISTGSDHVVPKVPPPYRTPARGAKLDLDAAFAEVEQALASGRPVSMSTQGRDVQDGLEEGHAYMVVGASRDPQNNDALLKLRNPYGNNDRAGEGNRNVGAGWNTSDPEITVRLGTLVKAGSFGEFNIGPDPRVQTQQQTASQSAHDPRNPEHPDHKLYAQIEAGVRRIDAEKGREFDTASERLALATFRDAKAAGITSADHIALNQAGKPQPDGAQIAAGTSLFVVQGKDPSDPLAPRSTTDVKQAIDQPVEHHLQKIEQLQQQQTQTQAQGQVMDSPAQADIAPKALKL